MMTRYTAEQVAALLIRARQFRSIWAAAKALGVAHSTLYAMARGEWFSAGRRVDYYWCPVCAAPVEMPCRACAARGIETTSGRPFTPRVLSEVDEPQPLAVSLAGD